MWTTWTSLHSSDFRSGEPRSNDLHSSEPDSIEWAGNSILRKEKLYYEAVTIIRLIYFYVAIMNPYLCYLFNIFFSEFVSIM